MARGLSAARSRLDVADVAHAAVTDGVLVAAHVTAARPASPLQYVTWA